MAQNKRISKCGFTMVEVLLALTILSIVGVCLFSVFAGGIKISKYATSKDGFNHEVYWVSRLLSSDLENAVFVKLKDASGAEQNLFQGQENSFTLAEDTDTGLKTIKYYLSEADSKGMASLLREEKDFVTDEDKDKNVPEVIASHIAPQGIRFEYGYQEKNQPLEWRSSWALAGVPMKMRADIDFVIDPQVQKKQTLTLELFCPSGILNENDKSK
ncbi:MAG: prepilin-type N-terminal cleavage/methylation domain-containing protein [Candidatus Omnitrophica bacterium]|nr:prepilin-type N-terminal cleavage/methylation domain-containing protein [Candidatus Omnitrophota bacterium]